MLKSILACALTVASFQARADIVPANIVTLEFSGVWGTSNASPNGAGIFHPGDAFSGEASWDGYKNPSSPGHIDGLLSFSLSTGLFAAMPLVNTSPGGIGYSPSNPGQFSILDIFFSTPLDIGGRCRPGDAGFMPDQYYLRLSNGGLTIGCDDGSNPRASISAASFEITMNDPSVVHTPEPRWAGVLLLCAISGSSIALKWARARQR